MSDCKTSHHTVVVRRRYDASVERVFRAWQDPAALQAWYTPGDDNLTGTSGPDVIVGLSGNDTIDGLEGDDRLCGSKGADLQHPSARSSDIALAFHTRAEVGAEDPGI